MGSLFDNYARGKELERQEILAAGGGNPCHGADGRFCETHGVNHGEELMPSSWKDKLKQGMDVVAEKSAVMKETVARASTEESVNANIDKYLPVSDELKEFAKDIIKDKRSGASAEDISSRLGGDLVAKHFAEPIRKAAEANLREQYPGGFTEEQRQSEVDRIASEVAQSNYVASAHLTATVGALTELADPGNLIMPWKLVSAGKDLVKSLPELQQDILKAVEETRPLYENREGAPAPEAPKSKGMSMLERARQKAEEAKKRVSEEYNKDRG